MGLADGDLYVSGSILSYQQANRIYQNFRAATVPSALQAGALWSCSADDKLHHQGTSELLEVFTEKTILTWENLLSNSGFGVWSQSDASKGLATITYDTGAKGAGSAPSVGDAIVGGTSGATAKLISYTIASGTWAGGDAAGVLTVGAVSHDFAFVDNEVLTFDGVETAAVNMPDSAVQVGLVQNGGFAAATTGWTAVNCTLASIAGGQVGNCLELTRTGGADQEAYSANMITVIGKIYKASIYVKSGTSGNEAFSFQVKATAHDGSNVAELSGTSSAAWVAYTITFEATTVVTILRINKLTATAGTMLFDEITCYEITPCCTAVDIVAMDGWFRTDTGDIYRQHNDGGTLTKDGSFYSLKLVPGPTGDYIVYPLSYSNAEWCQQFAGRTVTFGCWLKTSKASHARFRLSDSAGTSWSSYHTGGGAWEWIEVTRTIDSSATLFYVRIVGGAGNVDGSTIVYISQPMLIFGSSIGEGNYQPRQGEIIWLEKYILGNTLHALTGQSDKAMTDLNIEADSDGKLPKGCKSLFVYTGVKDSGSAASADYFALRASATEDVGYINSVGGKTNDSRNYYHNWQKCDQNGDVDYEIAASGAGTFDIDVFRYLGIQLN